MEGVNQTCQSILLKLKKEEGGDLSRQVKWDIAHDLNSSDSMASSDSQVDDDASSSPSSADGPLFQLSDLMNQLPIRRGLSKHYQGKSQSFTSLAHVRNLAKKVSPYGISSYHRMKSCKSYAAFDKYGVKATTITHKSSSSRGSF